MLEYLSQSNPAVVAMDKEFYEAYARPNQIREYNAPYVCNFLEMRPERVSRLSLNPVGFAQWLARFLCSLTIH
ncbi:hypothetical protein BKA59DRAFT_475912 [Fusarium tricinctum]|uniref:Uncharacterized protein n=1 Tax=Fusarium tricinctum TaxID=61284 RepID=A0A8K0WBM7_9HYPO|nr:hypothetical protein BKA59DRAFT_475912 [Fusarium tricinctum]